MQPERPSFTKRQIARPLAVIQANTMIPTPSLQHGLFLLFAGFCSLPEAESLSSIKLSKQRNVLYAMTTGDDLSSKAAPPQSFRNLQAIIFDIDGTLADSWKLGYDATLVVLENNNIPKISLETYHECTRYATPDRLARHAGLEPGHVDYETVGARLTTEFDNLYVGLVNQETAGFYQGIDELLKDIPPSIALGALTNACVDYAHAVLRSNEQPHDEATHYSKRFRSVRGADNVPKPKPAPDGLLQVCKDLNVQVAKCVYIGDSPSDAMAARNAGMPSIGVLWGSHSEKSLREAPFSILCQSVEDLRSALNLVLV